MEFMDRYDFLTFYEYVFLRRVNYALEQCGDNAVLLPNRIYCALAITAPRTRHVYAPEEKTIFNAGVILSDGFYYGQTSYLNST